ncbi:MAG: HD domain-containing protein, partial [Desulfobacteraceae bacterium]
MALTLEDIKTFAEKCFSNSRGSHDWEHSRRVYNLCMHIGQAEGADMEVLKIATYLHDVGRAYQDESKGALCHAEKGAEMANE